jgi:hypothetical protein
VVVKEVQEKWKSGECEMGRWSCGLGGPYIPDRGSLETPIVANEGQGRKVKHPAAKFEVPDVNRETSKLHARAPLIRRDKIRARSPPDPVSLIPGDHCLVILATRVGFLSGE